MMMPNSQNLLFSQVSPLDRDVTVTLRKETAWPVYEIEPTAAPYIRKRMVFLHGGDCLQEIPDAYWHFARFLAITAQARCIMPFLPPAKDPASVAGDMLMSELWDVGRANVVVIGSGPGAQLALAATLWLRDSGVALPRSLGLISPLPLVAPADEGLPPITMLDGTLDNLHPEALAILARL